MEGSSEENFINRVLAQYFVAFAKFLIPTVINTKVVEGGPNYKGGLTSFKQFDRDLRPLLRDTNAACITTMIDLYGIKDDFPDFDSASRKSNYMLRADCLENALSRFYGDARFMPYLSTHEYEALTLYSADLFINNVPRPHDRRQLDILCAEENPESINGHLPPGARIKAAVPRYRKPLHGTIIAEQIGLAELERKCPRFSSWVQRLRAL